MGSVQSFSSLRSSTLSLDQQSLSPEQATLGILSMRISGFDTEAAEYAAEEVTNLFIPLNGLADNKLD